MSEKNTTDEVQSTLQDFEYYLTDEYFDQLISLASEVCLSKPLPDIPANHEPSLNRKLIMHQGALALRAALELSMNIEPFHPNSFVPKDENDDRMPLTMDTPLRDPSLFYDVTKPHIIDRTEAFGKAIIEEAFAVLGEDAIDHIADMQSTDRKEQVNAIIWLNDRIRAIERAKRGRTVDEDSTYHYHPARVSPKLTGQYPNNNLSPTCLMASILASSFFEKAGSQYMHAGVAKSQYDEQLSQTIQLVDGIVEWAKRPETDTAPALKESMERASQEIDTRLNKDTGYHAAVYVKLADDSWMQVDPFLRATGPMPRFCTENFNKVYDTLLEFQADAPHLELSCYPSRVLNFPNGLKQIIASYINKGISKDALHEALDIFLDEKESVPQQLFDKFIMPHFTRIMDGEDKSNAAHTIKRIVEIDEEREEFFGYEPILQETFYELFDKYVLWGEPIEAVQVRALKDGEYLHRRIQDLLNLPLAMCAATAIKDTESNYLDGWMHENAEVGLPYVRVGMSVLSDFAGYCDDSLPPSFWASHWPSLVPITETMQQHNNNQAQKDVIANLVYWQSAKDLTYTKATVIISEYIQSHLPREGQENDDRSGEARESDQGVEREQIGS